MDAKGVNPAPIVVPYFAAGDGHLSAARAVAAALEERGCGVELVDVATLGSRRTEGFYVSSWDWILRHRCAGKLAFAVDSAFPRLSRMANRLAASEAVPKARELLDTRRPALLLATHWGAAHVFALARREARHRPPLFYVFTELGGSHNLLACGADRYFVMSTTAAAAVRDSGVPSSRIEPVAPVVHDRFLALPDRDQARRRLQLDPGRPVVLYGLGGAGIGRPDAYIDACTRAMSAAVVVVATGRNSDLRHHLSQRFAAAAGVIPLPFRDDMDVLLAAADLVAGKCGLLFTLEAMSARRPFVITHVGAPNERHSRDFVVRNGYGWYAPSPREFARTIRRVLVDGEVESARRALAKAPLPTGAAEIAETVIAAVAAVR